TATNLARGAGFTAFCTDIEKPANTLVARYGKDGKECLIPQQDKNPRMLTPRECARLQGYPETFKIPVSKAAAYKQFGNSVALPEIKKIAEKIFNYLEAQ
ncbi:MAG: DNA cytosine methyltransferase, partial [Methylovulum sp.]|nr:DNA cytosine methyltransferase [Methylovulum sp.]